MILRACLYSCKNDIDHQQWKFTSRNSSLMGYKYPILCLYIYIHINIQLHIYIHIYVYICAVIFAYVYIKCDHPMPIHVDWVCQRDLDDVWQSATPLDHIRWFPGHFERMESAGGDYSKWSDYSKLLYLRSGQTSIRIRLHPGQTWVDALAEDIPCKHNNNRGTSLCRVCSEHLVLQDPRGVIFALSALCQSLVAICCNI